MAERADEIAAWQAVSLSSVTLGEAHSFDAVTRLGHLAARTDRIAAVETAVILTKEFSWPGSSNQPQLWTVTS
ncbi:hypothetical protein AB0O86_34555 [Streptomyces hirsutus]|uniref:hypothetical protein n=1 Tax=Streptomyces hirsutus TaxID=35620 RepID=UPI00342E57D2